MVILRLGEQFPIAFASQIMPQWCPFWIYAEYVCFGDRIGRGISLS